MVESRIRPGATGEPAGKHNDPVGWADCSFNEIHLRHGGGGDGWTFSDMAIAILCSTTLSPLATSNWRAANPLAAVVRQAQFPRVAARAGLPQNLIRP